MARKRPPLVAELARLLAEYPERDWRALSDSLNNENFLKRLTVTVDVMADLAAKSRRVRNTKRPTIPRRTRLAEIAKEDPEKAQVLTAFRNRLTDKIKRPSMSQLRGLATALGMKDELHKRREQAVNQIIRYLADRTVQEIETVLNIRLPEQRNLGREYGRWVNLILRDPTHNE